MISGALHGWRRSLVFVVSSGLLILALCTGNVKVAHAEEGAVSNEVYAVTTATYTVYAPPVGRLERLDEFGPLALEAGGMYLTQHLMAAVSQEQDAGWQYTLTLNGLTVTQQQSGGFIRANLPPDAVSYSVLEPAGRSGVFVAGQPQVIMATEDGAGKGLFHSMIELNVSVPSLVVVSKAEGVPGLSPGQQVGALTGEYRAHMTFTLVSGL